MKIISLILFLIFSCGCSTVRVGGDFEVEQPEPVVTPLITVEF